MMNSLRVKIQSQWICSIRLKDLFVVNEPLVDKILLEHALTVNA